MRRPQSRAFTLIESIVSVVILATATPAMIWAVREAHLDRVSPVLASRARWLATEKLEDIIADRHSTTRGYTYLVNGNYTAEASISGYAGFTRSVAFAETGADLVTAGTGYKKATVTVGWTDARGSARSLAISTVLTDYTP
jgi:prepilin-type N-terminal cleavage/methylation domain-containing protein